MRKSGQAGVILVSEGLSDHEDHRPLQKKVPACGESERILRLYHSLAAKGGWNIPSWGKSQRLDRTIERGKEVRWDVQIRLLGIKVVVREGELEIWAVPCTPSRRFPGEEHSGS